MKPSETVGFQRLAIRRNSSMTALFAVGSSEYSLTKLWPSAASARKRTQRRSSPSKPSRPLTINQDGGDTCRRNKMTEAPLIAFKREGAPETTLDVFGVDVTLLVENEHTGDFKELVQ